MAPQPEVREHRCDFWILFWPSEDIPGQWVAHCLNLDIISQGNSLAHAREMIFEAVALSLTDDLVASRNPMERPSAPPEYWEKLNHVLRRGKNIKFSEILPGQKVIVATMMRLVIRIELQEIHEFPQPEEEDLLPAWLCAAVSNPPNRIHV